MSSKPSDLAPQADRLVFSRFTQTDAPAFACVLSDPEVTRSIMAKATTPEQCLECAQQRIAWHNSNWDTEGYGVWALREQLPDGSPSDTIIGWCGLTSTSHGPTPEILYGFARSHWGGGLATEAARATINWAFEGDICDNIDAVIFGVLNPGSSAVAGKLGMTRTGKMRFADFLPEQQLGRDVLDYEIWRLGKGACLDFRSLLFQAPFKAGLLVSAGVAGETGTLTDLLAAAHKHPDGGDVDDTEIDRIVSEAFGRGIRDCDLDVFRISRLDWAEGRGV
ncbi:GNAT family N-acetyltransferase [Ruegeria sp. PrR005]|uniref:GNAT family N-acetyltransferase n=1 Tax=Ruegeria sp. PrR005 TaxID=2706882 RepID=A0A6B2NWN2_9RHOB|nr:GNAT family N-acetyltransferase [Ruegeria sp. PrR005]NDW46814.1 GNAT family N-acetyltransferase [Ruegeria sp. PrR005]